MSFDHLSVHSLVFSIHMKLHQFILNSDMVATDFLLFDKQVSLHNREDKQMKRRN